MQKAGATGSPKFSSDRYVNKIFDGRRSKSMNKNGPIPDTELKFLLELNQSLGSFTKNGVKAKHNGAYRAI
jgi:hypothetical protein